jgi:hypothetical protein
MGELAIGLVVVVGLGVVALQLPRVGRPWLLYWHGLGAAHQHEFFRCEGCRRLVTWHLIATGGCRCRQSIRLRPAVLSVADKARLLLLPWSVTPGAVRQQADARRRRPRARDEAADAAH